MSKQSLKIDEEGRICLPPELVKKYGLVPGAEVVIEGGRDRILLNSPVTRLARIYVEPTSLCNLGCATCIRHSWDEPMGHMKQETWEKVLDALDASEPVPEVFFGGFGEPLSHPDILTMIGDVKKRGARVELITNGTLLTEETSEILIRLGLDQLWISIDGATPESYSDVRLGNMLDEIKENILNLRRIKDRISHKNPALGITFVAMKRNIGDLPAMSELLYELGASTLHVSNVIPHTEEMREEVLYQTGIGSWANKAEKIIFPRMDINETTWEGMKPIFSGYEIHDLAGGEFVKPRDTCPFIEKGSMSVRYDGLISPCLPLLHTNTNYLKTTVRRSEATSFGSLEEDSLLDIWNDRLYTEFRTKVMKFDFAPCTACNSCEMAESNAEDCFGSVPISCGGCLWAQGFIQCP